MSTSEVTTAIESWFRDGLIDLPEYDARMAAVEHGDPRDGLLPVEQIQL